MESKRTSDERPGLPVVVDTITIEGRHIRVVRDDLFSGGTKQRACLPYLAQKMAEGAKGFVYASPFSGFAQVALAISALELKVPCVVVCEEDKTVHVPGSLHAFSQMAAEHGAVVEPSPSLQLAEDRAATLANLMGYEKLPLGFGDDVFKSHFRRVLTNAWREILWQSPQPIRRVWLPVGSGTLAQTFHSVVPDMELMLVDVRVLGESDSRIENARALPGASYRRTPELFAERYEVEPPIPSNAHYDAKLWRFLKEHGRTGDLWWNVAR